MVAVASNDTGAALASFAARQVSVSSTTTAKSAAATRASAPVAAAPSSAGSRGNTNITFTSAATRQEQVARTSASQAVQSYVASNITAIRNTATTTGAVQNNAPAANANPGDAPEKQVEKFVNSTLQNQDANLQVKVEFDKQANRLVYKSVNPETGDVERQFPEEAILNIVRAVRQTQGLTVDATA